MDVLRDFFALISTYFSFLKLMDLPKPFLNPNLENQN